jgi:hypothetical protein
MVDTSYDISAAAYSPSAFVGFRWATTTNNGVGPTLRVNDATTTAIVNAPNQPQWADSAITPSDYMYRTRQIVEGQYTLNTVYWNGDWYRINTDIIPRIAVVEGDYIVFIAEVGPYPADGTILGRAQYTITIIA